MSEEIFSLKKLKGLLHQKIGQYLDTKLDLPKQLEEFENSLKETLKKCLDKPIGIEMFFSLNEGLKFREIYKKNEYTELQLLSNQQNKPLEHITQTLKENCWYKALKKTVSDICLSVQKAMEIGKTKKLNSLNLPVEWLERFEDNYPQSQVQEAISEEMDLIVKTTYFGLNEEKVRNILNLEEKMNVTTYGKTLNFQLLLRKLNITTKEEAINYLLNSNIGIYLKESASFTIEPFLKSEPQHQDGFIASEEKKFGKRTYQPISLIAKEIKNADYDYPRYGHVRLIKHPRDIFYWGDNVFFDQFYKGDCIEKAEKGVPLESSLAEQCLGIKRVIKLEKGQKITLNNLVFFEDEIDAWINRFAMQNFYSEHNAKIIEDILDKERVTLKELSLIFSKEISSFFFRKIKTWKEEERLKNEFNKVMAESLNLQQNFQVNEVTHNFVIKNFLEQKLLKLGFIQTDEANVKTWKKEINDREYCISYISAQEFDENALRNLLFQSFEYPNHTSIANEFLFFSEDMGKEITEETFFKVDITLDYLISKKILPEELRRLPRLSENEVGFSPKADYYAKYNNMPIQEIIKLRCNYVNETPASITYNELVKRFKKKGLLKDKIRELCYSNKLGAYLKKN